MTIQEAIKKLDENIPEPNNKMVDLEHLPIAIAWKTVKEELEQTRKETLTEVAHYLDIEKGFCGLGYMTAKHFGVEVEYSNYNYRRQK